MSERVVDYPRRDRGPKRVAGKTVEFVDGRWASTPIVIHCGPRKAART